MTWLMQWAHSGFHPFDLDGLATLVLSAPGQVAEMIRRVFRRGT